MEYEILSARDLDSLGITVNERLKSGWRLKSGILEHLNGYAQEVVRYPMECVENARRTRKNKKQRWINLD